MNEKRPTPDPSAGKGRRKSAAPTIDLTATEIPAEVSPKSAPVTGEAESPTPQAAAAPEIEAAREPEPAPESTSMPPPNGATDEPRKSARSALTLPVLAAGLTGAAVMSAILLTMWLTGLLPIRFAGLTMTRARVSALEMQLQDLQKRPADSAQSNAVDTKTIDALAARVARMEESLTKIPAGDPAREAALAERVTTADNAMKSLGVAITALNKRSDDIAATSTQARERAEAAEKAVTDLRTSLQDVSKTANAGASSADLAPLQQRIVTLEQTAKAASTEIAKASASDAAARLAFSAASLRDAVLRGAPFTAELAQARALGADEKTLAPFAPYAANGVPGEKTLAAELSAILPGMIKAAGSPPASGGFIERLQANASQLVRIRPVDAPVGDDTATVLARLEVDAAKSEIAAALADLGKLGDTQRAPAQAWIVKAQSRQAALAAARQFATDAARSLGSK